jgi:hypothetical protein
MLPAQLGRMQTYLLLFDHPYNLRFGEMAFPQLSAPSQVGQTLHQTEGISGVQVRRHERSYSKLKQRGWCATYTKMNQTVSL